MEFPNVKLFFSGLCSAQLHLMNRNCPANRKHKWLLFPKQKDLPVYEENMVWLSGIVYIVWAKVA